MDPVTNCQVSNGRSGLVGSKGGSICAGLETNVLLLFIPVDKETKSMKRQSEDKNQCVCL